MLRSAPLTGTATAVSDKDLVDAERCCSALLAAIGVPREGEAGQLAKVRNLLFAELTRHYAVVRRIGGWHWQDAAPVHVPPLGARG